MNGTAANFAADLVRAAGGPQRGFEDSPIGKRLYKAAISHYSRNLILNERETAAVLTGLRMLRYHHAAVVRHPDQGDTERHRAWASILTNNGRIPPLAAREVDALHDRIRGG